MKSISIEDLVKKLIDQRYGGKNGLFKDIFTLIGQGKFGVGDQLISFSRSVDTMIGK